MRCRQMGQCWLFFSRPLASSLLNSDAERSGNISFRPAHIESSFESHKESFPAAESALKSINILNSGNELAMRCPSQLRMLPRVGLTGTESFLTRSATCVQYSFFAVMMYRALPMTARDARVMRMAMALKRGMILWLLNLAIFVIELGCFLVY